MRSGLRPLRRIAPGRWRSRDERFEFIGGDSIQRGDSLPWWDSYERGSDEPVYDDRSARLAEAVDRIERDYYISAAT